MADFMKVDMSRLGQAEGDLRIPGMAAPVRVRTWIPFGKPCGGVRLTNGRGPEERSPTGDVGLPVLLTRIPQPRPRRFPACFPG